MNRRTFTQALATAALTAAAPSLPSKAQSAETAPQAGPFPLSVMLWTVFTELPFEQRLAKIAEAGYSNVELVGSTANGLRPTLPRPTRHANAWASSSTRLQDWTTALRTLRRGTRSWPTCGKALAPWRPLAARR